MAHVRSSIPSRLDVYLLFLFSTVVFRITYLFLAPILRSLSVKNFIKYNQSKINQTKSSRMIVKRVNVQQRDFLLEEG